MLATQRPKKDKPLTYQVKLELILKAIIEKWMLHSENDFYQETRLLNELRLIEKRKEAHWWPDEKADLPEVFYITPKKVKYQLIYNEVWGYLVIVHGEGKPYQAINLRAGY